MGVRAKSVGATTLTSAHGTWLLSHTVSIKAVTSLDSTRKLFTAKVLSVGAGLCVAVCAVALTLNSYSHSTTAAHMAPKSVLRRVVAACGSV